MIDFRYLKSTEMKTPAEVRQESSQQAGDCIRCGQKAKVHKRYCADCLRQQKLQRDEYKAKGLCQSCGKLTEGKARCSSCLQTNKQSMDRLKLEVFNAYGECPHVKEKDSVTTGTRKKEANSSSRVA